MQIRRFFEEAAQKACKAEVKASRELDAKIVEEFKGKGMKVNELSPDTIKKMTVVMKPVYDKYKDKFGVDAFKLFGYTF